MKSGQTVGESVYNYIVEKIKTKQWVPNAKIMTEKELCQELGVSRVSVRQALDQLVAQGLLTKRQGAGTFVANIDAAGYMSSLAPLILLDKKDFIPLLEVRIYLESGNVALFVQNYSEEEYDKLQYYYKEMKKSVRDISKFYIADFNFHDVIAKGTKNIFVKKISSVLNEILRMHHALLSKSIGPEIGIKYHAALLSAIKRKDSELAELLMRRHIEEALEAYKKSIVDEDK